MQLFGSKSISSFIYYLSKFGYYYALCVLVCIILALLLGITSYGLGWENPLVSLSFDPRFALELKPLAIFIKGGQVTSALTPFIVLGSIGFYTKVLYHSSKLFDVCSSDQIFKDDAIGQLTSLVFTFSIATVLYWIALFIMPHDDIATIIGLILLAICPILFFTRAVFQLGTFLQEDLNHTI